MSSREQLMGQLSKEELKLVKKSLGSSPNSQMAVLFELLQEFGDDEQRVSARFKRLAPRGNESVVRHSLQQLFLETIYDAHRENSEWAKTDRLIFLIKKLAARSAYSIAGKLLEKALEIAAANELLAQWVELLDMKIYYGQITGSHSEETYLECLQMHQRVSEMHANYVALRHLGFRQMRMANTNYLLRTEQGKAQWQEIAGHALLSDPEKALSKMAQMEQHILRIHNYYIFTDYEKLRAEAEQLIALYHHYSFLKKNRPMHLLWAYSQLAHAAYFLQEKELLKNALHLIRNEPKEDETEEVAAFAYYAHYGMAYYDLLNDAKALVPFLHESREGLRKWGEKMKPDARLAVLASAISSWVEMGEYEESLSIHREFTNYIFKSSRMDPKIVLLFYELIAQIETGNEVMVSETLQNFNRYLMRHDLKSDFEKKLLRFLKIISSNSPDMKSELAELKEQLQAMPKEDILAQHPVLFQILMNMIESKVAGQRYHEYMKQLKKAGA
ncbi:MAG: hypothetical protein U0T73_02885 [Chitinophagales bacterium]